MANEDGWDLNEDYNDWDLNEDYDEIGATNETPSIEHDEEVESLDAETPSFVPETPSIEHDEEVESLDAKTPSLVNEAVEIFEGNHGNDEINEPKVGMSFQSCDDYSAFCFTYALKIGFELYTRSNVIMDEYKVEGVTRKRGGDKEPQYYMMSRLRLACKKGAKKSTKNHNVTGCPVFIEGRMTEGLMVIKTCNTTHNHPVDPENIRFTTSVRQIGEYFKKRIMLNDRAGMPINKNFNAMVMEAGGHENLTFNHRDVRNVVNLERRLERIRGDAAALEDYFIKMKMDNTDFFYAIKKDKDNRLMCVFWADARCRAQFKVFGDVVTYDTTFLCNRYRMPFSPFIGVNHHGNSICFAAALIKNEDAETFIWVFERWLECMGKPPAVILTDQCKAIKKAIEKVFPGIPHRLCLWHIMKNAVKNLGSLSFWRELNDQLKDVVHDSLTETEFEEAWEAMVEKFNLRDNRWLKESYLLKEKWVPAYWRGTFCAGMSSTQRSEQANRFFKVYVSLETGLRNFLTQFEIAQETRVEEEKRQDFLSKEKPPYFDNTILVEVVFSARYTNNKFKELQEQASLLKHTNVVVLLRIGSYIKFQVEEKIVVPAWKQGIKNFEVTFDTAENVFECMCKLFEFKGILCIHIIACIEKENIESIPDKYILDRWRKDLVRGYETIPVGYYNPEDSARAKRSMELTSRNDYISKLALHDDESYGIYLRNTENLIKELESHVGIETINRPGCKSKVWCRRRIQPRECNFRHVSRNTPAAVEGRIKDPVDKRGNGRAPKPRQTTYRKRTGGEIPQSTSSQRNRVSSEFIDLNN